MSKIARLIILSVFLLSFSVQSYADQSVVFPRIINGTAAADGEFPFQVSLMKDYGSSYSTFCGGTLISDTWVVTAAHCIAALVPTHIIYGTNEVYPLDSNQTRAVAQVIVHSGYDESVDYNNDIALLRLESAVGSQAIDYVSTTNVLNFTTGTMATVSGWGLTDADDGNSSSDILMKVDIPIYDQAQCVQDYSNTDAPVSDNMICAGYDAGGYDSCQGDSGGPLFVQNDDGTDTLIGIVSYGVGCATAEYPGVYTKVANYVDWIEQNTGLTLVETGSTAPDYGLDSLDTTNGIDGGTVVEETATFQGDPVAVTIVGGDTVEDFSFSSSSHTVSATQDTISKLSFKLTPTDDGGDAAIVIDFTGSGDDVEDYNFYMCDVVTGICSRVNATVNTSDNWARIIVENNGDYDYNKNGIYNLRSYVSTRDIVDKVDADVYITENNAIGDLTGGGGGGGCSAAGEGSAFSFFTLMSLCGIYLLRRKLGIVKK